MHIVLTLRACRRYDNTSTKTFKQFRYIDKGRLLLDNNHSCMPFCHFATLTVLCRMNGTVFVIYFTSGEKYRKDSEKHCKLVSAILIQKG